MRVTQLMICKGFGGAERNFVDTALALADRGHAVQTVCHRDFVQRAFLEAHPGIVVSPLVVRGVWDLRAVGRLRRLIGGFGPDVVHCHLARGARLGGQAARRLGVPAVAKMHNYAKLKYYSDIDGFIGTTLDQARYLKENGIEDRRVAVIPNFSRMPVSGAPRAARPPGSPVHFVTCGRLHTVKGYDILLRSMSLLRDQGLPARLSIGGDGPERESLRSLTRELRLDDCVEFAGWLDDPSSLLDRGDIYVLSSRTESFGIALLEAMARGLPVVSTRCQGPAQLLSEDECWFAPPEDAGALAAAMRAAILEPIVCAERSATLRTRFLADYSEECVVPRILDFYRHSGAAASPSPPQALVSGTSASFDETWLVRPDAALSFRELGWNDTGDVMVSQSVDRIRFTNGRDNCRLTLRSESGPEVRRAFLKRHWETRPGFLVRRCVAPGLAEAIAVDRCRAAGVPVMQTLATGVRWSVDARAGAPVRESFFLSEAIDRPSGFDVVVSARRDSACARTERVDMRPMIAAAARTIRRMHEAGLFHQDLYWQHLFFEPGPDGQLNARLIDVQRMVRPSSLLRWHYWWKDMEQVRFSLQRMGFERVEVDAWYRDYFSAARPAGPLTLRQRLLAAFFRARGLRRAIRMSLRRRRIASGIAPVHKDAGRRAA